ncbi:MAG: 4-hydroxythreonine-4-phosphate dehydrogenase PdxA [Nitrospirae bacterium]|nr:4-hydroxythreonine-4-phosphate dehydrogenase PdxA [Nitrospirota bacterium]
MIKKPIIGITMGDPAGIGPEVIVKAFHQGKLQEFSQPIVIGDAKTIEDMANLLNVPIAVKASQEIKKDFLYHNTINVIDLKNIGEEQIRLGFPSKVAGRSVVDYIKKAVELAMNKKIDAITTAPINKEVMNASGYPYRGHTELLAELTGTKDFGMMMVSGPLRIILVTTHLALKDVPKFINKDRVYKTILLANKAMKYFNIANPKIGVAALNPHAGEGKLFGTEEWDDILPAVIKARGEGIDVTDPSPADTLFYKATFGHYDVIVAMYHDQGLIPLKMLAFGKAVNITIGLPIIRTSVDHGTAYDIAGRGIANPTSMIEAVKLAAEMAKYS